MNKFTEETKDIAILEIQFMQPYFDKGWNEVRFVAYVIYEDDIKVLKDGN